MIQKERQFSKMQIEPERMKNIKAYFETKPVLKAYIFGSMVKGKQTEDSDIDILIELDYSKRIGLQFIQMKLDLEKLLQQKVDLVSANGISPFIKPHIEKEKQLIYAR